MLRRALVCLAFSFFCFSNTWVELAQGEIPYFARYAPLRSTTPSVFVLQTLIAAGLWAAWEILRRQGPRVQFAGRLLFLIACLVPAGILSVALLRLLPAGIVDVVRQRWFWPVTLAILVPAGIALLRRPRRLFPLAAGTLLWSWPVLLVVIFQSCSATLLRYPSSAYADGPLASRFATQPGSRVVWIVFDELSQELTFDRRPAGVGLPNFDLLRRQGFYATQALAAAQSTQESLPALLLGRPVSVSEPQDTATLLLTVPGQTQRLDWQAETNVFRRARGLGVNSALAGWFHPYGRLLHKDLTDCSWTAGWLLSGTEQHFPPQPLLHEVKHRVRCQLAVYPLLGHLPGYAPRSYQRQQMMERFQYLLRQATTYVSDPALGLVFLHLPVPHPPAIYSRATGSYATRGPENYFDSLALADRTLGQIRQAIRSAGLEDRTTLIVSSDHGWRPLWRGGPDWTPEEEAVVEKTDPSKVPFLLHLPGTLQTATFDRPFSTVATSELVLRILQGRISAFDQIPEMLTAVGPPSSPAQPASHSRD